MGFLDRFFASKPPQVDYEAVIERAVNEATERIKSVGSVNPSTEQKPGWPYALDQPHQFWMTTSPQRLPGKIWTVSQLRAWADHFDPLRSIIEYIKGEVSSIPIVFWPRPEFAGIDLSAQVGEAMAWVGNQGPLGGKATRRVFEAKLLEDALIVGAYAVWYEQNRLGQVLSCDAIDAGTIKPCVDNQGWPHEEVPFEQWITGVKVAEFREGDLRYDGFMPITSSPYFKSPVEYAVGRIMAGMNLDNWNLSWLTESNVRTGDVVALPADWSVDQVVKFSEFWNSQRANAGERQKTKFLPAGSSKIADHSRKDQDFEAYEMQVIRRLCGLFGIQAASVGYVGEQYKVTQGDSMSASRRVGVARCLQLRKEFYDDLLLRLGFDQLECADVEDDTEMRVKLTAIRTQASGGAYKTINEVRAEDGLPPIDGGDAIRGGSTAIDPDPQDDQPSEDETEEYVS